MAGMHQVVRRVLILLGMLLAGAGPISAQGLANPLRRLLRADTAGLGRVLARPGTYRVQILYTRIRRDAAGRPHFRSFRYRLRPREYFYPASAASRVAVTAVPMVMSST